MTKKPIDRLYGLPRVLILLLGLAKYLDLFPVPAWLFAFILVWGAIAFMVEAVRHRKKFPMKGGYTFGKLTSELTKQAY